MKALVFILALAGSTFSSAVPATSDLIVDRDPLNVHRSADSLEARAKWKFECYSEGKACRGTGDTSGGGKATAECSKISDVGCTRYSFDGGGEFKLCVYDEDNCAGEVVQDGPNGGSVTCLDIENPSGYLVTNLDEGC